MFKKAVKRTIGKVIRRTRSYVQSLEKELDEKNNDQNETHSDDQCHSVHLWSNSIFAKLLREKSAAQRPWYTWGVLQGVRLAKAVGIERISVIEFGVAGGNGLLALEQIADKVGDLSGVAIDTYGFDTGCGLPKPLDYRDCPNLFAPGRYPMDEDKLRNRLRRARLMLGLVEDTVSEFIAFRPSPVAFISFDLDYYSSTMQAFKVFEAEQSLLLPRIHCYFDDIMGFTYSEYTGERLAIAEFNESHTSRKISPIYGLKYFLPQPHAQADWSEMLYIAHIFDHELYGREDGSARDPFGSPTDLQDE
jgi:hypothetical protein